MLALISGDRVDESDGPLLDDCGSFGGFPITLKSLDKVAAGCRTAAAWLSLFEIPPLTSADVLTEFVPLPTSERRGMAVVDGINKRTIDVDGIWPGVFMVRVFMEGLLLDATSGVGSAAAATVEEVAAKAEVSGLASIRGAIDEEDIAMVVEIWVSAGVEGISVWLRYRATLWCL